MKHRRDINLKIPDIKLYRKITTILGRLGINASRTHNPLPPHPWIYGPSAPEWYYGWTLTESKSYVEMKYMYINANPDDSLGPLKGSEVHEIKSARQLMGMLSRLGLKTPDAGLLVCRKFVTHMRNR